MSGNLCLRQSVSRAVPTERMYVLLRMLSKRSIAGNEKARHHNDASKLATTIQWLLQHIIGGNWAFGRAYRAKFDNTKLSTSIESRA